MTTAPSPWTTKDHDGPAKGHDTTDTTDSATTADAPSEAPVNPLLGISRGRQLPDKDASRG